MKVVNVYATVRDKQGQIVRDLNKDDFDLKEDGRPQLIRYFSQQTDLPLTIGLLVDTSGSERRMIGTEKDASTAFLEQVMRPEKDNAFLIHFDHDVELLQDVTSSRPKLEKALDQLDRPQWAHTGDTQGNDPDSNGGKGSGGGWGGHGGAGGYGGRGRHGGSGGFRHGTALYDAVYLASHDVMKDQSGRKALMLLSDGQDSGSKVSLAEAITTAQRSDTLVYSIRIADEESENRGGGVGGPGMGRHGGWGGGGMGRGGGPYGRDSGNRPDGKKILQQISRETGGGYFEVSKKKTVGDIYRQIEEELRSQYSLGYTSDRADTEGGYRKIELTVRSRKNLVVQARDGYYAGA
ncbi:MAG: VWA domain-containing protein [Acidobacteriaceae bacterium]|nr:VWA domain-containing protein [Acidobacteriaceae bacterium]